MESGTGAGYARQWLCDTVGLDDRIGLGNGIGPRMLGCCGLVGWIDEPLFVGNL